MSDIEYIHSLSKYNKGRWGEYFMVLEPGQSDGGYFRVEELRYYGADKCPDIKAKTIDKLERSQAITAGEYARVKRLCAEALLATLPKLPNSTEPVPEPEPPEPKINQLRRILKLVFTQGSK